jgi:TRAP-type C4-dicarboxylate transport system substrate-binding protein
MGGKTMKRLAISSIIMVIGLVFKMGVVPLVGAAEQPLKQIVLRAVTSHAEPFALSFYFNKFIDLVNKRGAGKIQIKLLGGAEVVPPFETVKSLGQGLVDIAHTTPAYYPGSVPEASTSMLLTPATSAQMRGTDSLVSLLDEIHRKKAGVTLLGWSVKGGSMAFISKKPITKADLTGLKTRAAPSYRSALRAMGAEFVVVPLYEVYSSFEKNLFDAGVFPVVGSLIDLKLYEVVKYIIWPPLPVDEDNVILANAKLWDGLPTDVKKIIMDVTIELENEMHEYWEKQRDRVWKTALDRGMTEIRLPTEEAKKWRKTWTIELWKELVLHASPENGKKLTDICTPLLEKAGVATELRKAAGLQ